MSASKEDGRLCVRFLLFLSDLLSNESHPSVYNNKKYTTSSLCMAWTLNGAVVGIHNLSQSIIKPSRGC
jgi:hypothetical protein